MGNPQTEYLEAMSWIGYPFVSESAAHPEINRLFADFYAILPRGLGSSDLVLDSITFSGGEITGLILKSGGVTIFTMSPLTTNANVVVTASSFGTVWLSKEITVIQTGAEGTLDFRFKFVVRASVLATLPNATWSSLDLPLLDRCFEREPNKVNGLYVTGNPVMTGDVVFRNGTNVELVAETTEDNKYQITISAVPGSGSGKRSTGCDGSENAFVTTINGFGPNESGDLAIDSTGCHFIHTDTNPTAPIFKIINVCVPCMSCNEVQNTYCILRGIWRNASMVRTRMCESLVVYDDYLTLLKRFICELSKTKIVVTTEQTDAEAFDVIFRMQVGAQADIWKVVGAFSYGPGAVTATFRRYSGRRKLPGLAPVQLLPPVETGFDGTLISYNFSLNNDKLIEKNRYASWYWNMSFLRCDGSTAVIVSWTGTAYRTDGSTIPFSGSRSLNVIAESCSS